MQSLTLLRPLLTLTARSAMPCSVYDRHHMVWA
nr:MAG TPA: hypothetical protein [Caudoviricetes sp.]